MADQPRSSWWRRILWWRYDVVDDEPDGEGGRTWKQVSGYGERVLEPGRDSAEEEATHAEHIDRTRRPPRS